MGAVLGGGSAVSPAEITADHRSRVADRRANAVGSREMTGGNADLRVSTTEIRRVSLETAVFRSNWEIVRRTRTAVHRTVPARIAQSAGLNRAV